MEFELWLFAVKQLAQSYEMTQVIFSQLPEDAKEDLRKEYESTMGGGSNSAESKKPAEKTAAENKTVKEYHDLLNNFHNAMSIVERFVEKNNIRSLNASYPIDATNPDEEFLHRMLLDLEAGTISVVKYLNSISRPVSEDGVIKKGADGQYVINNTVLKEGMIVEFFNLNRWETGRLCKSSDSVYGYFFLGFRNEIFDIELEGLRARLRGQT